MCKLSLFAVDFPTAHTADTPRSHKYEDTVHSHIHANAVSRSRPLSHSRSLSLCSVCVSLRLLTVFQIHDSWPISLSEMQLTRGEKWCTFTKHHRTHYLLSDVHIHRFKGDEHTGTNARVSRGSRRRLHPFYFSRAPPPCETRLPALAPTATPPNPSSPHPRRRSRRRHCCS